MAHDVNVLDGQKKEIWEMATLMADAENPTEREVARELVHAKTVVDGIDEVMGWVTGKTPRPSNKKPFKAFLQDLQDEIDRGEFDDED